MTLSQRSPSRAAVVVLASAAVLVLGIVATVVAGPQASAERRVPPGTPALAFGSSRPAMPATVLRAADWWGGTYRGRDGTSIRVYVSDDYPVDPARIREWVEFLESIPHGRELADLTLYVAPESMVSRTCGTGALGCYFYDDESIFVIGDDLELPEPLTVEQILAHEYGHHVANNRENPPWNTVQRGTKRWASVTDVCACIRDESIGDRYDRDPGEGFAETYRVLVDRMRGLPYIWPITDDFYAPTARRLDAARTDVLAPWRRTTERRSIRLAPTGRTRSVSIRTPLDGAVVLSVIRKGTKVRVAVVDSETGRTLARGTNRVGVVVCGERSMRIDLRTITGPGTAIFSVTQL